jgi:hypothetical protein
LYSQNRDLDQLRALPAASDVFDGFFVDVLLANWDVVGLTGDNLILALDGIYRIDPGGTMTYRAQGGRKGRAFSEDPRELTTMKDPRVGNAGRVFGSMTPQEERRAASIFQAVSWPQLLAVIERTRLQTVAVFAEWEQRGELAPLLEREFAEIVGTLRARQAAVQRSRTPTGADG